MLLKITNQCTMGCSHCSENCTSSESHMTMDVFNDTLKFISKINPMVIIVTGGEPTLHPNYKEIIKSLIKQFGKERIVITSNGLFILEGMEKIQEMLSYGVLIQVTNDHRYYPTFVPFFNHPLIAYENKIRHIYPLGRALTNNIESYGTNGPKCFNIRSICRGTNSFIEAVRLLEKNFKFCTPSIGIDGSIKAGEFNACNSVGTVLDSHSTIFNNIRNLKCNNCKMEDKLSEFHLNIIK